MFAFLGSLTDAAVDLVATYPSAALAVTFAAAIIEAVAVLGILIPGTPIVMAVAGAAAMAGHPMLPYIALAILGAVIGDFISFWFGSYYQDELRRMWPFSKRPTLMESATAFFDRYGVFSVALCRLIPVLRSTVPLVAGMAGMNRRKFVIANVASAVVWGPAHVYPAALAGLSIESMRAGDWNAAALWATVFAGCILAGWMLHHMVIRRRRQA